MSDFWEGFIIGMLFTPFVTIIVAFYTDMWCSLTYRPSKFGWFDNW